MTRINVEGGCLCGAIRYRISGNVLGEVTCHCRDCQYVCGGAPAYVIAVPKKNEEQCMTSGAAKDPGCKRGRIYDLREMISFDKESRGVR